MERTPRLSVPAASKLSTPNVRSGPKTRRTEVWDLTGDEEPSDKKKRQRQAEETAQDKFKRLYPWWAAIVEQLYVAVDFSLPQVADIIVQDFPKGFEQRKRHAKYKFSDHTNFASESYQQFLIEDVLRFERDSSVLIINSQITMALMTWQIPPTPPESDRDPASEAWTQYRLELDRIRVEMRKKLVFFSQRRISQSMFPLRTSSVRFPFRAVCFVMPPNFYSVGDRAVTDLYDQTRHYSLLVYHLDEPLVQEEPPKPRGAGIGSVGKQAEPAKLLSPAVSTRRLYSSRDASSDGFILAYYSKPRMYHYDSSLSQANRGSADALAQILCKVALLLDETGDVDVVHANASKERQQAYSHRPIGRYQLQNSCATWTVAYAEKIQDACLRRNFAPLSEGLLSRMNELCSADLVQEMYSKLIGTAEFYRDVNNAQKEYGPFGISQSAAKMVAESLGKIVRFRGNSQDDRRLKDLAEYLIRNVYFGRTDEPRSAFLYSGDDKNLHPDLIRLYLAVDLAVPDDVMFGVGQHGIDAFALRWNLRLKDYMTRASQESLMGYAPSRVLTAHYRRTVVDASARMPRLVVWLQLPDPIEDSDRQHPMILAFRPLYRSTLDSNYGVVLNTLYVWTASSVQDKLVYIEQFLASVQSWLPNNGGGGGGLPSSRKQHPRPGRPDTGAFDDVIHIELDKRFGRYGIMHFLRAVLGGDCDLPDTPAKSDSLLEMVSLKSADAMDEDEMKSAAAQHAPRELAPNVRVEEAERYLGRRFMRQLYGRVLHVIAGQESFPSAEPLLNLDDRPFVPYSAVPIRENASAYLTEGSKERFGRSDPFSIRSRWIDRTRILWASMYFGCTFRGALEAAVYQATRAIDPDTLAALEKPDGERKVGLRIVQCCPYARKAWHKPAQGESPQAARDSLPYTASIHGDWAGVGRKGEPQFMFQWRGSFPIQKVPRAPATPSDYLRVDLSALASYARKVRDPNPGALPDDGFLQFPVLLHGERVGLNDPVQVPLDAWDMLAIASTEQFWIVNEDFVAGRKKLEFIGEASAGYGFDASARILQHDPFAHVVAKRLTLQEALSVAETAGRIRGSLRAGITLGDVCGAGGRSLSEHISKLHLIANYSFADVCLLCVMTLMVIVRSQS